MQQDVPRRLQRWPLLRVLLGWWATRLHAVVSINTTCPRSVIWVCLVATVTSCSAQCGPSSPPASQPVLQASPEETKQAPAEVPAPVALALGDHVGSGTCEPCHEERHATWAVSYHRTMTQAATPETTLGVGSGSVVAHGREHVLEARDGAVWAREVGRAGERRPLTLLTGSHRMQAYWVSDGQGGHELLPFTWLVNDQRLVPRNAVFLRSGADEPQEPMRWQYACMACHTVGARARHDPTTASHEVRVAELGIACEACHGPGREHVDAQREADSSAHIVNPSDLSHERGADVCGQCHGITCDAQRLASGGAFRPGASLDETSHVLRRAGPRDSPCTDGLAGAELDAYMDAVFWADGMPRVTGREYNGLIESSCFRDGELTCTSCHDLHGDDPNAMLSDDARGNAVCHTCHSEADGYGVTHTKHEAESPGSLCYSCHMPRTTYGLLAATRSHLIDSPSAGVDERVGRPNACSLCHTDRSLAWAAGKLTAMWGVTSPALTERTGVAHSVNLLLTGDAAQRALAAWALGQATQPPSAGTRWQTPLLLRTLEDPMVGVRYLAKESLRRLGGLPPGYDFVSPALPTAALVDGWLDTAPPAERQLLARALACEPPQTQQRITELLRDRDDTPMTLSE
jgi:predicted CXXCH cytochrome family protein